jgi:hypothetical protein
MAATRPPSLRALRCPPGSRSRAPGAGVGGESRGDASTRLRLRLEGFYKRLDTAAEWWRMFRPEQTFLDVHLRLPSGSRNVRHCTRECRFNHAVSALPSLQFFRDAAKMNPIGLDWDHTYVDEPDVLAVAVEAAMDGAGTRPIRPMDMDEFREFVIASLPASALR